MVATTASGLERLLRDRETTGTASDESHASGEPTLLRLDDWHVYATPTAPSGRGRVVAEFTTPSGDAVPIVLDNAGVLRTPFSLDEAYANYVEEAWADAMSQRRVSSNQLALFYRVKRFIPRRVQLALRRRLIRWQGSPTFPRWPLDDGVDRLLHLHAATRMARRGTREIRFDWFWPDSHDAALILSHDVESFEGIRLAVELADLEESLGFRSSFNFGAWYEMDEGILRDLTSRGFEIGMHGIVHDRSLFSSRAAFEAQLAPLRSLAERLGAVGFRSPATHRVFPWIADLPIAYDGTIPHSDPYEPQPGGCCSLWPFFVGDVVELPYTLPQDHTLLTLLGHRTPTMWIETADAIVRRHGLIHCISHPDRGYLGDRDKRAIYGEFLQAMSDRSEVWHALPAEVASWWRARDGAGPDPRTSEGRIVDHDRESPGDIRVEAPSARV